MKKLLALLLLFFMSDAMAQVLSTTGLPDPVASGVGNIGTQTYVLDTTTTPLYNINNTTTNGTPLYLGDDNVSTIQLPFNFEFFGNIFSTAYISSNGFLSFTNHGNGCCSGLLLPDLNWSNSIFGAWSDLNDGLSPFIKTDTDRFTVGWYTNEYGTQNRLNFEISLFSNYDFTINYGSMPLTGGHIFTAGIMGDNQTESYSIFNTNNISLFSNTTYNFLSNYTPPTPLSWSFLVNENDTFTLSETSVVRYGANDIYVDRLLAAGTYSCSNSGWGSDPLGGVYKHCDIGSYDPPVTPEVNCTTDPWNPQCTINSVTDPVSIATSLANDTTNTTTDITTTETTTTDTIAQDATIVASATPADTSTSSTEESTTSNEETLNSRLPNATTINNDTPTTLASTDTQSSSSLQAQDSSKPLSDNISSNLLQLVLSIVDATSQQQETKTVTASTASASSTTETASTTSAMEETVTETQAGDLSMEILATGVAMNNASQQELQNNIQESLALTDQIIQAGNTENSSSNTAVVQDTSVSTSDDTNTNVAEKETTLVAENTEETKQEYTNETTIEDDTNVVVAENIEMETSQATTEYTETSESQELVASNEDTNASNVEEVQQTTEDIDDNNLLTLINTSQVANNNEITEQTEEVTQPVVSNLVPEEEEKLASDNKTFEDQSDTELLASILDNAGLAQTVMNIIQPYNYEPSVADREQLGVLGKKEEDKSDAEKKAEKIVAANKEEQENIKSNYFDADQSGILGAIAGDVDVTSYRTTMLPDNNVWYKPEEIYKNVTYKDNSRGLYFLEKGSTDTYKKMVEEQYK